MTLISVDFPAPFSPTIARVSPPLSSSDTPDRATVAPNRFEMSTASRTGPGLSALLSARNVATFLRALTADGVRDNRPGPQDYTAT